MENFIKVVMWGFCMNKEEVVIDEPINYVIDEI
jgi:hypothetical protein